MTWKNDAIIQTAEDRYQKLIKSNEMEAKTLRDEYIVSDIEVGGSLFQVDDKGRDNMRNAIETGIRQQLAADTIRYWILSDNSFKAVTMTDLENILDAYTLRMDATYVAYTEWRNGDKQEPFVIG